jgi:hypothetical protein
MTPRPPGLAIHPCHPQPEGAPHPPRHWSESFWPNCWAAHRPLGVLRPLRQQQCVPRLQRPLGRGTASVSNPTTPTTTATTERSARQPCHRPPRATAPSRVQHASLNTGNHTTPPPPPPRARYQVGIQWIGRPPCGPSSVNSVLLRRTSWYSYRMADGI